MVRLLVLKTILSARGLLTLIKRLSGVCRTAMVSSEGGERHPRSPLALTSRSPKRGPTPLGVFLDRRTPDALAPSL